MTNMDLCFFHPDTMRRRAKSTRKPLALRVATRGGRTPVELEIGEKICALAGYQSHFVVATACSNLEELGETVMIVSSGPPNLTDLETALDPRTESSRTVLARLGECFSSLALAVLRLQDEGIVHADITADAVAFDPHGNKPLLGKFARAIPMQELTEVNRARYYPAFDPSRRHLPPEYHLITVLVHAKERVVSRSRVDEVCQALKCQDDVLGKVVGLEREDAIVSLESTWRTWDAYALALLFERVVRLVTEGTDTSLNPWLCGALSVWENCHAHEPLVRPSLAQLRRLFEKAWYRTGSVEDCQSVVDAVDLNRARSRNSLPLVDRD